MSIVDAPPRPRESAPVREAGAPAATQPPRRRITPRPADLLLSTPAAVLVCAGMFALLGPIASGDWLIRSCVMILVVFGLGYALRRLRVHAALVPVIVGVVSIGLLTVQTFPRAAVFGFFPTGETWQALDQTMSRAYNEILFGVAPLAATFALTAVLVIAATVLAVLLEAIIVGARAPLVGGVLVLAIGLIPPLIVPGDVNLNALVPTFAILFLVIRRVTALQEQRLDPRAGRSGPAFSAALIAVVSLVGGVSLAPFIEGPHTQIVPGFGPALAISPTVNLGQDLRQPRETEVMTVRSDMSKAPYLRISTLSQFNGRTWIPDTSSMTSAVSQLEEPPVANPLPDLRITQYTSTIDVKNLSMRWLALPYPATGIEGLTGDWRASLDSRTLTAQGQASAGSQSYVVTSTEARPTAEQIRGATTGRDRYPELTQLPENTPLIVSELARSVTADATNDYDRLVALQSWFRSPEFTYSLKAPVEQGFDGDGLAAVEKFLEVKAGYCTHYAATFTLMARSLGMPARIVVGFLPGSSTNDIVDSQRVYMVTSSQLHAWPEVYFEGIGWIPFEPTQSLGTPTTFAASQPVDVGGTEVGATTAPDNGAPELSDEDVPTTAPTASAAPETTATPIDWWPTILFVLIAVAVLLVPAVIRTLLRQGRLSATRNGSAPAAWREVVATLIDVGGRPNSAQSPRDLGAELVKRGAPEDATRSLVSAIERASYGNGPRWQADHGDAMATAVVEVRAGLLRASGGRGRFFATVLPLSLISLPATAILSRGERIEHENT